MRSIRSLKSAFIIEELSIFGELYRKITYPEFLNNRFFRWDLHMKIRDKKFFGITLLILNSG